MNTINNLEDLAKALTDEYLNACDENEENGIENLKMNFQDEIWQLRYTEDAARLFKQYQDLFNREIAEMAAIEEWDHTLKMLEIDDDPLLLESYSQAAIARLLLSQTFYSYID